jgi:hypothetical protein
MSQAWFDVVRVGKHEADNTFHAFCEQCGLVVPHCTFCFTRPEYINSWCRECHNNYDGKTFHPCPSEKPRFLCQECDKWDFLEGVYEWKRPSPFKNWELYAYSYKPYNARLPLSPGNFIRQPLMEPVISNAPPKPHWKRDANAWQAFKKEKEFSGSAAQALIVYASFFQGKEPLNYTKDPEEGRLTLREILRSNERPSNKQFLKAIIRHERKANKKKE